MKNVVIGAAWPYVNGDLHPGHIAGYNLPADVFARYQRLIGNEVMLVSGADCYGTPITLQADKENTTPEQIVKKYAPRTKELLCDIYKTSYDLFTQTHTKIHNLIVQIFFLNLLKNGYITRKFTKQYYSEKDNRFYPDRYVEGECMYCHTKDQRADQCEACGRTLVPGELLNPRAKLTGSEVVLKETEHYFFSLSSFKDRLKHYLYSKKDIWRDWVWKETEKWINELEDRSLTRDLDWGVEIPIEYMDKKDIVDHVENKRLYVWFDAVIGYFSAAFVLKYGDKFDSIKDLLPVFNEFIAKYWDSDDTDLVHYIFVGQDNLFFHTIWWPALLMGQETNLKLPDNVVVNYFLNLEGQKFSKSRGIYINARELVSTYGLDAVRYYLIRINPENSSTHWYWEDFKERINNELVATLGNFIHRTLIFYAKYLGNSIQLDDIKVDYEVIEKINSVFTDFYGNNGFDGLIGKARFKDALDRLMDLARFGNVFFDRCAPWKSAKEDPKSCANDIYNCLHLILAISLLISIFLPDAGSKLAGIFNIDLLYKKYGSRLFQMYDTDYLDTLIRENLLDIQPDVSLLFSKIDEILKV